MDIADALSESADIHMPQQVGWWPLAFGWGILIALLLALAGYGLWRLFKRMQLQRRLNNAIAELDKCQVQLAGHTDDMQQRLVYVNNVNSVLRRVALAHFPHTEVAGLSGRAWVDFLRSQGNPQEITTELGDALSQGRFAPSCDVDTDALHNMARHWIKNLYMTRIDNKTNSPGTATEHHA